MTTDRELLESAASAAGFVLDELEGKIVRRESDGQPVYWDPLQDDGDAFRLAVKLGIHLQFAMGYAVAYAGSVHAKQFTERCGDDECAATRRAIVLAAAAMA